MPLKFILRPQETTATSPWIEPVVTYSKENGLPRYQLQVKDTPRERERVGGGPKFPGGENSKRPTTPTNQPSMSYVH